MCSLVSVNMAGKRMFGTFRVNTKIFFFILQNKQFYLRQQCGSTGLVCLSPLKGINLDERFTVLYTWETAGQWVENLV